MGIQINGQTDTISSTDGSLNIGGTVTVNVTGDATGLTGTPDITVGAVTASSATISGDLTVNGTTTTLDTTLTEVDKLEVGANNTTVGVAITQSGTGDILRLYDGASQVVTVKDGGNIGIGTESPDASFKVTVEGRRSAVTPGIYFKDTDASPVNYALYLNGSKNFVIRDQTNTTDRLTIDSSGRLLVGTNSDVSQGSSNTSIQVRGASDNLTGELWLARNETSTTADGNEVGKIAWSARDPAVAAWRHTAYIISDVDGTPGNSQMPGRIEFHTNSGSFAGSPTERMRINSSGNLILDAGGDAQDIQMISHSAASGHGQIYMRGNASGESSSIKLNHYGYADYVIAAGRSGNGLFSITGTDGGTDGIIIDTSGRLLVGMTSASGASLLQVSGDARINSHTVGRGNFSHTSNTAFGNSVLASNTNYNNTAFGDRALTANTSGGRNTAFGSIALRDCTTANNNTAVGCDALYQLTTGNGGNTAVGDQSGRATTTGHYNTTMGYFSAYNLNTGNNNVCVGYGAGYSITSGAYNVCIGELAGDYINSLTTGVSNVLIGNRPTPSAAGGQYQIVIGTHPTNGQGKGNATGFISPNGGGVYQGNNSSSWSTTSDRRLKKNIVDNTEGLDVINQVRVVNFEYRLPEEIEQEDLRSQALVKRDENDEITGLQGVKIGVIAQELQQICSDCVKEESSGVLGVVDDNLFWHMVNAVKELSAQNAALEARLTALEGQ